MNVVGNPSSVHSEGRAAKNLIENARLKLQRRLVRLEQISHYYQEQ